MLDCSQFLEDYSSFRDGRMAPDRGAEFELHMEVCGPCARYHEVVARGVELVRDLEPVELSADFIPRLQHRIYHLDEEMSASRRISSGTSVAFTLAIAVAIGMSAWTPAIRPTPRVVELPPVLASAPVRKEVVPSVFRAGPLLTKAEKGGRTVEQGSETLFFRYTPLGAYTADPAVVRPVLASNPR